MLRSYQIRILTEYTVNGENMSSENEPFEKAAAAKSLPEKPDDSTLLEIYALYKQGSGGEF